MASGVGDMDNLFGDIGEEFEAKKSKVKDASKKSNKPKAPEIVKDGKRVQNISIMMASLTNHGKRSLGQLAECVSSTKKQKQKTKQKKQKIIFSILESIFLYILILSSIPSFQKKKTQTKIIAITNFIQYLSKNNSLHFSLILFF